MKALLIDGPNLIRRIYAAVPNKSKPDSDPNSDPTSVYIEPPAEHITRVISSVCASLQRALNTHYPTHCVAIFEYDEARDKQNWRYKLFPDYKKERAPMPVPLQATMPDFESAFNQLGVGTCSSPDYKTADVIATLARKIALHRGQVVILSTDRILCQLLNSQIQVYDHFANRYLDSAMIKKKFQVNPDQIPDLLALAGDSRLSIPGIKSIGIRTATKLINTYDTLENVLAAAANMQGKLGSKLCSGKDDARLAYQLFTLKTDIDLGINLNRFRYPITE